MALTGVRLRSNPPPSRAESDANLTSSRHGHENSNRRGLGFNLSRVYASEITFSISCGVGFEVSAMLCRP
jgi:hypothetical protein